MHLSQGGKHARGSFSAPALTALFHTPSYYVFGCTLYSSTANRSALCPKVGIAQSGPMAIDIAYHLTNGLASLLVSPRQVEQGVAHLHPLTVPQFCLSLVQPGAGFFASLSEGCVGGFGQVLQGMGPI